MNSPRSISELRTLTIKTLRKNLRRCGHSLGELDSLPGGGVRVEFRLSWTCTNFLGVEDTLSVIATLCKDQEGLYLEVGGEGASRFVYRLERRESNLKPGTHRYYFLDPFAPSPGVLCEKLYYLPCLGGFVTRSVLKSHRLLYGLQIQGHKDRLFNPASKLPSTKYRKRHYKGVETPFWRRYSERQEMRDFLMGLQLIAEWGGGIIEPYLLRQVQDEYFSLLGRKTRPWSKRSSRW